MISNLFARAWAALFARSVLGLIFFIAGVYKVFKLGPLEHARKYFLPAADTFLRRSQAIVRRAIRSANDHSFTFSADTLGTSALVRAQ